MDRGSFEKQGLDLELRQFNTGLEIFQALIGGSLDVLATGAVLSNFPARGQGKVFLINDIEVATAQLWVRGDQGIKSFEDLKGKRIATATGTTAHELIAQSRSRGLVQRRAFGCERRAELGRDPPQAPPGRHGHRDRNLAGVKARRELRARDLQIERAHLAHAFEIIGFGC